MATVDQNVAPLVDSRSQFFNELRRHWATQRKKWANSEVASDQWATGPDLRESHRLDPWELFCLVQRSGGWPVVGGYFSNSNAWEGFAGSLGLQATPGHDVSRRLPLEEELRAAPVVVSAPVSAPVVSAPGLAPAVVAVPSASVAVVSAQANTGLVEASDDDANVPGARASEPRDDELQELVDVSLVRCPPSNPPTTTFATAHSATAEDGFTMSQPPAQAQPVIVVDTPSNRRGKFSREDASTYPENVEPRLASMIPEPLPAIYRHCVLGLRCGIPQEMDFALGHMVVMSDERGDKFFFKDHEDLAEDLIDTILRVSKLTHGVTWEVGYDFTSADAKSPSVEVLNGVFGTRDILERLKTLTYAFPEDDLEDAESADEFRRAVEASLVLRNLVMEPANAKWLDDIETMRDCAAIVLSLPNDDRFTELKNNILDIVEQCSLYWEIWEIDPLYIVLPTYFVSDDRNMILTSLAGFVLFALNTGQQKATHNVPWGKVKHLLNLTYLDNDPELLSAILDFLYQYTLDPPAIDVLRNHLHLPTTIIKRMTQLLVYEAEVLQESYVDRPSHRAPPSKKIPEPPPTLYAALMQFPEPNRTTAWLRCCFVEDAECEITQLALWQAYQNMFSEGRYGFQPMPTLQATDFIATITNTFPRAQGAKVLDGTSAKYILRGIRPLETIYDLRGFPYYYCKWGHDVPGQIPCDYVDQNASAFRSHVLQEHLKIVPTHQGWARTKASDETAVCLWEDCTSFRHANIEFSTLVSHVFTHLPTPPTDPNVPPPKPERPIIQAAPSRVFDFYDTPRDLEGKPTGIAYKAALILRNIQWGLPNAKAGSRYKHRTWTRAMFGSIRTELLEIAAHNRTLSGEIYALVSDIDKYSEIVPDDQDNRW